MKEFSGTMLWWGRFDPEYSRNRLLRGLLRDHGWRIIDFIPRTSPLGRLEAAWRRLPRPDLVWVPAFRHRDLLPARRWSAARGIPLLFDPLISAYDKQVFERRKFTPESRQAKELLDREKRQMQSADLLLADTKEHSRFYQETLGAEPDKVFVVHVGAEENLFQPHADCLSSDCLDPEDYHNHPTSASNHILRKDYTEAQTANIIPEVLFYGSFIPLQGPQFIAGAILNYHGPPVRWRFLGDGPLLEQCRQLTTGLKNVAFENWLPYEDLPARIRRADILLGIFGETPKTMRVIPNKVFQAMACGKPVITAASPAYPAELLASDEGGLTWVLPANPNQLAAAVACLAANSAARYHQGVAARRSFLIHFAVSQIKKELLTALKALNL